MFQQFNFSMKCVYLHMSKENYIYRIVVEKQIDEGGECEAGTEGQ